MKKSLSNPHFDFRELSKHGSAGEGLEFMFAQLAKNEGLNATMQGRGSDFGCDFIVTGLDDDPDTRWLVSCKDYSVGNKSVPDGDVLRIGNDCRMNRASGFLLVTTTQPTTRTKRVLESYQASGELKIQVWNRGDLIVRLVKPANRGVFEAFLPESFLRHKTIATITRAHNEFVLRDDEIEFEGYCTCRQKQCTDEVGKVYCYWPRALSSWVKSKRLYWKCYEAMIECPLCHRVHKRGHIGAENICGQPYDNANILDMSIHNCPLCSLTPGRIFSEA